MIGTGTDRMYYVPYPPLPFCVGTGFPLEIFPGPPNRAFGVQRCREDGGRSYDDFTPWNMERRASVVEVFIYIFEQKVGRHGLDFEIGQVATRHQ